jgi:hypothetical protein
MLAKPFAFGFRIAAPFIASVLSRSKISWWVVGKQEVRDLGPKCRLALYGAGPSPPTVGSADSSESPSWQS